MTTKFTPAAKARFLEVLEDSINVKASAEAAGISRGLAYIHKKADLEFSREWDQAVERALDALLGTAYERATTGKSDQVLITLLRFRYGEEMRERLSVQVDGPLGLDADALLRMPADDRNALQLLLQKYSQAEQAQHLVLEHDRGEA